MIHSNISRIIENLKRRTVPKQEDKDQQKFFLQKIKASKNLRELIDISNGAEKDFYPNIYCIRIANEIQEKISKNTCNF